ncbi:hypothetical protein O3P69_001821 [Scylla paramamosain]|uniref:Uncharacterized protein n=1 Tax=Scylla paramamosain TaxID=85552 RepID=A0AAW0V0Z2_SCYPA
MASALANRRPPASLPPNSSLQRCQRPTSLLGGTAPPTSPQCRNNTDDVTSTLDRSKDSPLIPVFNKRITSMNEAGLFNYWEMGMMPNSSACEQVPTKITVSSSLSLRQCWAMLVVLGGGLAVGVTTLSIELVLAEVMRH